jgi:hypothetical protein
MKRQTKTKWSREDQENMTRLLGIVRAMRKVPNRIAVVAVNEEFWNNPPAGQVPVGVFLGYEVYVLVSSPEPQPEAPPKLEPDPKPTRRK